MIKLQKVVNARTNQVIDVIGFDDLVSELFESAKRSGFREFINTVITLMENKHYYRETTGSNFAREPKGVKIEIPVVTKDGGEMEEIEFPFVIKDNYNGFVIFKNGHICPITFNKGQKERVVPLETVLFDYNREPVTKQADASYGIMVLTDDIEKSIKNHNDFPDISAEGDNDIIGYFLHEEDK